MNYTDLCRLSFTAISHADGVWRYRDSNGRIWTLTTLGMSEPGYDPTVDDAICGKCCRPLSPLDLPNEHSPTCKGASPEE